MRGHIFFKDLQKVMITRGLEKGKSVWDALHGRFRSEIAVSQMYRSMLESTYHVAADTFKLLKHEGPERVGHHFDDGASERW